MILFHYLIQRKRIGLHAIISFTKCQCIRKTLNIKISIYVIVSISKTKKQDLVPNYNDVFLPYPKEMSAFKYKCQITVVPFYRTFNFFLQSQSVNKYLDTSLISFLQFSTVEVIITSLKDGFGDWIDKNIKKHEILVLIVCIMGFIFGIPHIFNVIHRYHLKIS